MKKKLLAVVFATLFSQSAVRGFDTLNTSTWGVSSIASVVVLAATSGISTVLISIGATADAGKGSNDEVLMRYMTTNHVQLKRDFSISGASFFTDLGYELGLTKGDINELVAGFEGSKAQKDLIQTLNGTVTSEKARMFSSTLVSYVVTVVGPAQLAQTVSHIF